MGSQTVVNKAEMLWREGSGIGNGRCYQFRPACPADRETIIANINAIGAERVHLPSDQYAPTPSWEAALDGACFNGIKQLLAVIEIDKTVVGHGRLFPQGFGHKDRHVIDVGMGLLTPYRGLGIGTQFLAYLINWAQAAGYEKMTATIMSNNLCAQRLFARYQFKQEGRRMQQFVVGNHYVDELLVARFL